MSQAKINHSSLLTTSDCRRFHQSWERGAEYVARKKGEAQVFTMTGDVKIFSCQGEAGKMHRRTLRRGTFSLI